VKKNLNAKEYFSSYVADDVIRIMNHDLVNFIYRYNPHSVFEFGCGQGKNLDLIVFHAPQIKVYGMDISKPAVDKAQWKGRNYVEWGDEANLARWNEKAFDVSFTCSVLDHIEQEIKVDHILTDLKRISRKAVILYETQRNRPLNYYYFHDYDGYGLTRLEDYEYVSSDGDGALYQMWKWER
jgi:trans-aconitate methyltransferase